MKQEWLEAINAAQESIQIDGEIPRAEDDKELNEFLDALIPKIKERLTPSDFTSTIAWVKETYGETWLKDSITKQLKLIYVPCTMNGLIVAYVMLIKRSYTYLIPCWPSVPHELQWAYSDCGIAMPEGLSR